MRRPLATLTQSVLTLSLLTVSWPALADGLTNNGHINGEKIDLKLTPQQAKELDKGNGRITLTNEQRDYILKLTRRVEDVKTIAVLPATVRTCTCELKDVAIRTGKDKIEIATCLLGRDYDPLDSPLWPPEPWLMKELKLTKASPAFILTQLAVKAEEAGKADIAIDLYKQALAACPKLGYARQHLRRIYSAKSEELEKQGKRDEALSLCLSAKALTTKHEYGAREGLEKRIIELTKKKQKTAR
ncbi:MAG TPA: hypothetical protein PLC15_22960 [Candidatus Obscuribacter sp.]|nr:hypothetical protein [Candidatus Obscuribacter sp.]MBK9279363.1 hypothetical protein [Candidatus Obscuribacter sp.]HNB18267.1 hypothetical protein [Candidatus Obscuribacter sp.]